MVIRIAPIRGDELKLYIKYNVLQKAGLYGVKDMV